MKKYKLIKMYPMDAFHKRLLEESNKIVTWNARRGVFESENRGGSFISFTLQEIENQPEYWQEVIDKEYEIVAFEIGHCGWKITDNNCVYYQMGTGYKSTYPVSHITTMLEYNNNDKNFKIIAIKRLSDGEIFSIGDEIVWDWKANNRLFYTIKGFSIKDGTLYIDSEEGSDYNFTILSEEKYHLRKVVKKEPLFISKDNVAIFAEECYCFVAKSGSKNINELIAKEESRGQYLESDCIYRFSTKEAAQEWLDKMYPKPILTTVEGKECFEGDKVFILYRESKERPYKLISNQPITVNKAFKRPTENHLDFSTLEAANQYLIENTTLFSLKDIREVQIHTNPSFLMQDLREEAKKKLNIK